MRPRTWFSYVVLSVVLLLGAAAALVWWVDPRADASAARIPLRFGIIAPDSFWHPLMQKNIFANYENTRRP